MKINKFFFVPLVVIVSYLIAFNIAPKLAGSHFRVIGMVFVGLVLFIMASMYLLPRLSYENVLAFLVLTLPFTDAFLIEMGGSLRICYYFTILALIIGFSKGILYFPIRDSSLLFLYAYILYAAISLSYVLWIPEMRSITTSSLRGSIYRPYIQFAQLLLMASSFFVVLNYIIFSKENWKKACNWIFWSLVIVSAYAYYEMFSLHFNLPFLNFVNAPLEAGSSLSAKILYDAYLGDQREIFGILLVRPRTFMSEPQFLGAFLLFAAPLAYLSAHFETRKKQRLFKRAVLWSLVPVFVAINSRSGFISLGGIALFVLLLIKDRRLKRISIVMLLISLVFVVNMAYQMLGNKVVLTKLSTFSDALFQARSGADEKGSFLGGALDVFLAHPILGVGIGCAPFYFKDHLLGSVAGAVVGSLGNIYSNVFSELGLVGFFFFLAFIGTIFFKVLEIAQTSKLPDYPVMAIAWLISFVGTMIALLGSSGLYTNNYIWVMWAMGAGLVLLHKKGEV